MKRLHQRIRDAEDRLADPRAAEEAAQDRAWLRLSEEERGALLRTEAKCEALGPKLRPTAFVAATTEEEREVWLRFADLWAEEANLDDVSRSHNERYRKAMLRRPEQYERYVGAGKIVDHFVATSRGRGNGPVQQSAEKKAKSLYNAEEMMLLQGYYPGQCCKDCGWGHPELIPKEPCERCGGPVSYYGYYHLHVEPIGQLRRNLEVIDPRLYPQYHARMQSYLNRRTASDQSQMA